MALYEAAGRRSLVARRAGVSLLCFVTMFRFRCVRRVDTMAHEVYRIIIQGHLDSEWSEWFDGMTITWVDTGETILTGPLVDQTALHGVLIKIRDLGLPLLSLTRIASVR